ncbi:MAG: trimethylamine methyltransferase family protein, partial [Chloroflexota bacterium]
MQNYASLLSQEQVERIHEASLEILESVGLLVRNQKARQIFAHHGLNVDNETQVVKFPRNIVEQNRALFPQNFTFRGRDVSYDRTIPDDSPIILTGSS